MAKDPAFLFYPGDYLRDTQMLSEAAQVAYDRIMCEHMRNTGITEKQYRFLTKRLSEDEAEALAMVIEKENDLYVIPWVAESIGKRKKYTPYKIASATLGGLISANKLKNSEIKAIRANFNIDDYIDLDKEEIKKKVKEWFKHQLSICLTIYENEIENENENVIINRNANKIEKPKIVFPWETEDFKTTWENWKEYKKLEFRFKYKSPQSEQAALNGLTKLADNATEAKEIILQSMANGWKGFHEIKNIQNGKSSNTRKEALTAILNRAGGID